MVMSKNILVYGTNSSKNVIITLTAFDQIIT